MRVLDRAQGRIPQPWRTIVDWFVTVGVAVGFVLAFQAEVAKPYRIPTSSMEPTLHCAKPGAFCEGRVSDRVMSKKSRVGPRSDDTASAILNVHHAVTRDT